MDIGIDRLVSIDIFLFSFWELSIPPPPTHTPFYPGAPCPPGTVGLPGDQTCRPLVGAWGGGGWWHVGPSETHKASSLLDIYIYCQIILILIC